MNGRFDRRPVTRLHHPPDQFGSVERVRAPVLKRCVGRRQVAKVLALGGTLSTSAHVVVKRTLFNVSFREQCHRGFDGTCDCPPYRNRPHIVHEEIHGLLSRERVGDAATTVRGRTWTGVDAVPFGAKLRDAGTHAVRWTPEAGAGLTGCEVAAVVEAVDDAFGK